LSQILRTMKKILVPVDLSTESENALNLAVQIARRNDAQIILLHVLDDIVGQSFNTVGEIDLTDSSSLHNVYVIELLKKIKSDLRELKEREAYKGVNITEHIRAGGVYQRISESIVNEQVDLIVMGSKGSSGIEELLIGSNTEKVIRHAKCPVLTVKEKTDLSTVKKLLFASDLFTEQHALIDKLKQFVALLDLELTIAKINTHHNWLSNKEVLNQLDEFSKKYHLESAKLRVYDDGYIEDGIIRLAEMEKADIIAMGTHGRTGIAHIIAGSETENLANHSKRLIWTSNY